jgi:hypothetical protein
MYTVKNLEFFCEGQEIDIRFSIFKDDELDRGGLMVDIKDIDSGLSDYFKKNELGIIKMSLVKEALLKAICEFSSIVEKNYLKY